MNPDAAKKLIRSHEGVRTSVYTDTEGVLTIGVGFNLQKDGAGQRIEALGVDYGGLCAGKCELNDEQVEELFGGDFNVALTDAKAAVPSFDSHPDDVQSVLVDMLFNLGGTRFRKFVQFIAALESKPPDYCAAAEQMMDSLWAKQVPNRASEDAALVKQFCTA